MTFSTEAELETHMRHRHTQLCSSNQIQPLLNASKQAVDRLDATACPLCNWEPALRAKNLQIASEDILVVTPDQFRRHLGYHMEQLALFALPRSHDDECDDAESNRAAGDAESVLQSHYSEAGSISNSDTGHKGNIDFAKDPMQDQKPFLDTKLPWTTISLSLPKDYRMPFPFWLAAVSQKCTQDSEFYIHGGAYQDKQTQEFWMIDMITGLLSPMSTMNAPRLHAPRLHYRQTALLLNDGQFAVYGRPIDSRGELGYNQLWIFDIGED